MKGERTEGPFGDGGMATGGRMSTGGRHMNRTLTPSTPVLAVAKILQVCTAATALTPGPVQGVAGLLLRLCAAAMHR